MFQNSSFKEYFRTTTFEILCEGRPFLNKNVGCASTQFINRKGLNQSGFTENITKFSRAHNWNLTRASLENNCGKDLICYLVYRRLSRCEDFAWKKFISNTSKIEVARSSSFICNYYFYNFLFINAKKLSVLQFP